MAKQVVESAFCSFSQPFTLFFLDNYFSFNIFFPSANVQSLLDPYTAVNAADRSGTSGDSGNRRNERSGEEKEGGEDRREKVGREDRR